MIGDFSTNLYLLCTQIIQAKLYMKTAKSPKCILHRIVFMLLHLIWRVSVKRRQQWTFASSAWNFKRFSATQHWNRKWLLRIVRDGFWLFRHFSCSFHCIDTTAALQTVAHRQHALSSPDPDFPPCCLECIFHLAISLFKHSNIASKICKTLFFSNHFHKYHHQFRKIIRKI